MTRVMCRGWCWTINNPTPADLVDVERLAEDAVYVTYGDEVGEEGTPHLQGYCWYKNSVDFTRIKRLLPRAHIEKQKGTNEQAIQYCHKDGVYKEWGTRPEMKDQKLMWKNIIKLAEDGNEDELKSLYPRVYMLHLPKIRSLRKLNLDILQGELTHEWWYGETGCGKSTALWNQYPDHYMKKKNKWWDGYRGQAVVALEEWSPSYHMLASELKIWADRYPFPAEIKGGTLGAIRPQKIIVLSNYKISECFPITQDQEPLKRRFKVRHFPAIFSPLQDTNFVTRLFEETQQLELE